MTETENTELVKFHELEKNPMVIGEQENKFYVLLGMSRLTEAFDTLEEAIQDSKRTDWERTIQVMAIVAEKFNNSKN